MLCIKKYYPLEILLPKGDINIESKILDFILKWFYKLKIWALFPIKKLHSIIAMLYYLE